jgi:hypothetical protein
MAYGGYFHWASGETLNAEDVMKYLMGQSVTIWDTIETRDNDSAHDTSLIAGNLCFIQETNTLYYYDGSAWQEMATQVYVDTQAATARQALLLSFMESN